DLPFARAELDAVMAGLAGNASDSDGVSRVASQEVSTKRMLKDLWNNTKLGERVEQYRVVHFTGHYSSGTLMIGDEEIEANEELDQFVDHSVLVLDGCSSSEGLKAWTDMDTVTARLIHAGAIGCVVTALPLKNDPLITEWFWKAFYEKLRIKGTSVGQALRHARAVLKDRLEEQDVSNPAWLYYQLVGNPTVDLFAESVEWAGPR
ncbi:MAG TPA: CHAT domain-containing protein, partial [Bryobacteraceae bacterium]|nr:CHAT domain-containing protein [Bryobacteraceae bacterium]